MSGLPVDFNQSPRLYQPAWRWQMRDLVSGDVLFIGSQTECRRRRWLLDQMGRVFPLSPMDLVLEPLMEPYVFD